MRLKLYPEGSPAPREQSVARAAGHRLRAPGRLVRGSVVDAGRDRARPRGRRHRDRTRRARDRRPPHRGLSRRDRRSHDEPSRRDRRAHARRAARDGQRLLVDRGRSGHARSTATRRTCSGARRPRTATSAIATLEEVVDALPRRLVEPRHQAHRRPTSSPTRSCSRTSFAVSSASRSVIVARSTTTRSSGSARSRPRWRRRAATGETAAFYFSMLEGGARACPPVVRVPGARDATGTSTVVDERFVDDGARRGHRGARVDDQRRRARWTGCSISAWTASSATDRRRSPSS